MLVKLKKRTKSASKISKPDIDVNVNSDRGFKMGVTGYQAVS